MPQSGYLNEGAIGEVRNYVFKLCNLVVEKELAIDNIHDWRSMDSQHWKAELASRNVGSWCGFSAFLLVEALKKLGLKATMVDFSSPKSDFTHIATLIKNGGKFSFVDAYLNMSSDAFAKLNDAISKPLSLRRDEYSHFEKHAISKCKSWNCYSSELIKTNKNIQIYKINLDPSEFLSNFHEPFSFRDGRLDMPFVKPFEVYGDDDFSQNIRSALHEAHKDARAAARLNGSHRQETSPPRNPVAST